MCDCKIKFHPGYALLDGIEPDEYEIIYCSLHASAPQLQAENEKLREALKVAKQIILMYFPSAENLNPSETTSPTVECIRQINEALSSTAGDRSGEDGLNR